jgi:hypothetical protein
MASGSDTVGVAGPAGVVSELGEGRPVIVLAEGFAGSAAHQALARRFRVIVLALANGAAEAGRGAAAWLAQAGLDEVGVLGAGDLAPAALAAATAAKARSLVLVSPQGLTEPAAAGPATAVLIGSRDAGQPRDALSRYRRLLPGCRTVLVYGAGADIAAERPDALASAAGDFLDRQGRFNLMTATMALD